VKVKKNNPKGRKTQEETAGDERQSRWRWEELRKANDK
jgi:hypothetical protein